MGRSTQRRAIALLAVATLFFVSCSSDGDTELGDSPATTSASPSDPTGIVKAGFDLMQATGTIPLNPLLAQSGNVSQDPLYYLIYGRLLRPLEDGSLEPDLAESVDLVDSSTIRINLRDGLTFSDGSPLDAAAVKAYYDSVLDGRDVETYPGATLGEIYGEPFLKLQSATVTDPTTVTLSIKDDTAASWYDQYLSTWHASIVKVPVADPLRPIGAGPFEITDFQPGQSVTLAKSDSYWRADDVRFAGVEIEQVAFAQPSSGTAALAAGQLDMTFTDASQIPALTGDLAVYARTSPNKAVWLHMCKTGGPLADARVRVAFNKAIDREAISEAVYGGTATPSVQLWPNGHRLANPDLDETLAYDPEGARKLLQEAGFSDGLALDMYMIQAFNLPDVAQIMQQQLADVGITLTIVPTPDYVNQYLQNPAPNAVGMYPGNAAGTSKFSGWSGPALGNVCKYSDPALDAVVNEIKTVSEASDEAVELWHEAAEMIVPQALGGFVLFRSEIAAYDTTRLGDFQALAGGGDFLLPDPFVTFVKSGS